MKDKYDLIVVGAGPAGISAAVYAVRQGLKVLVISKDFEGQISKKPVTIYNYLGFPEISGQELSKRFEEHLRSNKEIDILEGSVKLIKKEGSEFIVSTGAKEEFRSKTVIVASGADPRPLEVPGEKEYIGKGVSYCALCDGALFKNKDVAIIGGGNSGFETAMFLTKIAKRIYLLEYSNKPKADAFLQNEVSKLKSVEVITDATLKEIKGTKFLESIVYLDKKENKEKELKVQGVFVQVGTQPATSFVKDLVDFSERDEILVDPITGETRTPGLFSAGDVSSVKYKQLVVAAGEGAKTALSAYNFLEKKDEKA